MYDVFIDRYFKRICIPDMDRFQLTFNTSNLHFAHANNTLVIKVLFYSWCLIYFCPKFDQHFRYRYPRLICYDLRLKTITKWGRRNERTRKEREGGVFMVPRISCHVYVSVCQIKTQMFSCIKQHIVTRCVDYTNPESEIKRQDNTKTQKPWKIGTNQTDGPLTIETKAVFAAVQCTQLR